MAKKQSQFVKRGNAQGKDVKEYTPKQNTSKVKTSKKYKKPYRGQGR